jgi:hypothetical protein
MSEQKRISRVSSQKMTHREAAQKRTSVDGTTTRQPNLVLINAPRNTSIQFVPIGNLEVDRMLKKLVKMKQ